MPPPCDATTVPVVQRRFQILPLAVLCSLTIALSCSGAAPGVNYSVRSWDAAGEAGLPEDTITTVVQTRDGYLWLGTYSGLARFDGVRFTVFDEKNTPDMRSSRVTALFESDDGMLWIGHENGTVTTFKGGKFHAGKIPENVGGGKIYAITADEKGDVWLLHESGLLARMRDGKVLSPPSGIIPKVLSLTRTRDGRLWVARDGKLSVMRNAELQPVDFGPGFANTYILGTCAAHDGGIWVANYKRILNWNGEKWTQNLGMSPWALTPLTCLMETKNGTLLAGTSDNGLFMVFPDTNNVPLHLNRNSGFLADWIISLLEDREGNFWVGTGGNGLVGLRPNSFQTVTPPDRWRGRAVLSVYPARNGDLWVGTEGAGLYRSGDGAWENFDYTNGINNTYVWSIAEDGVGNFFCGTWGGGLFTRDGNRFKSAPGMENQLLHVPALFSARDGSLWAGTENGLLHFENGRTNWFTESGGKPLRDVRAIAESTNGAIWFGMAGDGLACLEQNKIRHFSRADGLPSDFIECLRFDEHGALWIGTFGGGLCRLKGGNFSVIDSPQGLPNSVIGHIEDDGHGFYWMSSHGGILRADKKELNACADGELHEVSCRTFGLADGLPTLKCSDGLQAAGCRTSDGRLWFSTSRGLVTVDPTTIGTNSLSPPTLIEGMEVDDKQMTLAPETGPLEIGPGQHRIKFRYTGLSFIGPEKMRFKYRLQGLDDTWATVRNVRSVNYNFIPPGRYVFEVLACNSDGIWSTTPARLAFVLRPHVWQTTTFHVGGAAASVLLAGGIVWFVMRQRMRRKLERLERLHAIENERTRIANDIHDDLGAQLTRITMMSDSARDEDADGLRVQEDLKHIYDTAREATRAMDEIVWAVNPKHDRVESLASYLEKFGFDYLAAVGIRCRLDLPAQPPALQLTTEVRHNLFLAYKEALHNVVKHAAASEVRITLAFTGNELELIVEDNGRGFGLNRVENGVVRGHGRLAAGNGLDSMNRRIRDIGGTCQIQSEPGRGTKVTLRLKLTAPPDYSRND